MLTTALFLLALCTPLLYAVSNHIDKILLERYFKEGGVETLIMFSALLSVVAVIVLPFVDETVLAVQPARIALLVVVGFINALLLWAYLKAMFTDEPTVVIIFYQLVPVLGLLFGYIALGEVITTKQMVAMALIIAGAIVMSFVIDDDGVVRFRKRTVLYMLIASSCWALESTLFKVAAIEVNVWRALFWEHVTLVMIGVLLFLLAPVYRRSFLRALRLNSKPIIGINVFNEVAYQGANAIAAYVVVLIPISITLLMNGFQPLFVFVIGLILAAVARSRVLLWPQLWLSRRGSLSLRWLGKFFSRHRQPGRFLAGTHLALCTVVSVRSTDVPQVMTAIILTGVGAVLLGGWW